MNNWKRIWENRKIPNEYDDLLTELIKLDGFDRGNGLISKTDWLDYISFIIDKCDIKNNDSIFEVGCGTGAFLYPFYLSGNKVGGLDYSQPLIEAAQQLWAKNNNEVFCAEAANIPDKPLYDILISNSVFFYFPDYNYAENVLSKMIQKATKTIAILELPDKELFEECENMRKGVLGEDEYKKKYDGLGHLYYEKDWFREIAHKHNLKCEIFNQNIKNYGNSKFRFNCILKK